MQIIEVKNNLVRISYNPSQNSLILSGFVVIKDENQSFVAQIMHLEANSSGNFAILKLLFTFDDNGVITNYNGSIPNQKCEISMVDSSDLLELLPAENPVLIGELAQQQTRLKLDRKLYEENLLICSEKEENNKILSENIANVLAAQGKKVLLIDLAGNLTISKNTVTAGVNFKLPLNYETIDFIYERGLDDAKAESKALIQEVFLEVQNYVKTLPEKFIPFDTFKAVVDEQYEEMKLVELVLLKNKLLKYNEAGIFAQQKKEFELLENSLRTNPMTVLNLSKVDSSIQREMISYAYSLINQAGKEVYVVANINNANSDKKLLKQIFTTKNAYSTLICPYSYKYLAELKQVAKNMVLFAPIQQQQDFASYNTFLNKLNPSEFVIYGKATHHMPLIVELKELEGTQTQMVEPTAQPTEEITLEPASYQEVYPSYKQDLVDEQIKHDVDTFYTTPNSEAQEPMPAGSTLTEEDLTDDDLDFIETLNSQLDSDADFSQELSLNEDFFEEQHSQEEDQIEISEYEIPNILEDESQEIAEDPFASIEMPQEQQQQYVEEPKEEIQDVLPASAASVPIIPIYSADIEQKEGAEVSQFEQGDTVMHVKYGKGVIEKMISYGTKTLCSIHFDNVGRRLLDPSLAEIKKI